MKLLFKQRLFSWLDSYDIYNEDNEVVFRVEGKLALGHELHIFNNNDELIGVVKEKLITFLPSFIMYLNNEEMGAIQQEFNFFKPRYRLTCNDWVIEGDIFAYNYEVKSQENIIMRLEKTLFNLTDTYVLDIKDDQHQVLCLMIVLAIDAAKCSKN